MSHHVRIKICGITEEDGLEAAVEGGADLVGFVRWDGSPRHVEPDVAKALADQLPETVEPVGLFVDAPLSVMLQCPFQWIQLHGREDESIAEALKSEGRHVIRGFRFDPEALIRWDACAAVDRLLVDGSRTGGTGEGFDHGQLLEIMTTIETPLLVAGGLSPNTVSDVVRLCAPWGVDVSSGVERIRGEKDPGLIRAFCAAVRSAPLDEH